MMASILHGPWSNALNNSVFKGVFTGDAKISLILRLNIDSSKNNVISNTSEKNSILNKSSNITKNITKNVMF